MSSLALKTEIRGKEATGFWGAQEGEDGKIIYHKEPKIASEFIKGEMWQGLSVFDPSIFLAHCREPTTHSSGGSPKTNKNNHPHVSKNKQIALIHNGKVQDYTSLRYKEDYYKELKGDCDSEILLKMFEKGTPLEGQVEWLKNRYPEFPPDIAFRMYGLEKIFSKVTNGAMAVAIGERHHGLRRSLWFFKDEIKPLWATDLRKELGQIFFFSTSVIWKDAVDDCPEASKHIPLDSELVDFPPNVVYSIHLDPSMPNEDSDEGWHDNGWLIKKYEIQKEKKMGVEQQDNIPPPINKEIRPVKVVTIIDEMDEPLPSTEANQIIVNNGFKQANKLHDAVSVTFDDTENKYNLERLEKVASELKTCIDGIYTSAVNAALEGKITSFDFQQLIEDMESAYTELKSSKIVNFKQTS